MTEEDKPTTGEWVPCEVCRKEVPVGEARSPEGGDYVLYLCGLDCYQKWSQQQGNGESSPGEPRES